MASNVVKCISCNIVINELLSFIQNKMDVMDAVSLIRICNSGFSEEDIVTAKNLLFESVKTAKRKIQRKKEGKSQRDLEDIVGLMRQLDTEELPIFVARNLYKLPPVSFDHVDVTRLLKDIVILQQEISDIKENYARKEDLCTLKTDLANFKVNEDNKNESEGSGTFMDARASECALLNTVDDVVATAKSPSINQNASASILLTGNASIQSENKMMNDPPIEGSSKRISQMNVEKPKTAAAQVRATSANGRGDHINNIVPHPEIKSFAQIASAEGEWKMGNEEGDWKIKQRKRYRNKFLSVTGEASLHPEDKFRAADIKVPLFINNVAKDASPEDISSYIRQKTGVQISLERINVKRQRDYDAYKVFVPRLKLNIFMDAKLWPDGISFRRFVNIANKRISDNETTT